MARCPECGTVSKLGSFLPFCSERCRCVDLSRWLRGDFVISTPFPENERLPTDPEQPRRDSYVDEAANSAVSEVEQ